MSDLFWLTDEQMARLQPYFPKSHGRERVDDRRVLGGITFVNRNGLRWRDAPKGGMNTKLHAVSDANGRPISFFMTAGGVSDYTGAAALLDSLPEAQWMLADRGYDADWFRDDLQEMGITPCIPGRIIRSETVKCDRRRYKRRNRIEIMFGRLKDWRRVATRYDRCPKAFFSAVALAATVIFWL